MRHWMIIILTVLCGGRAFAQMEQIDPVSIEALINDHRGMNSKMEVRVRLEQASSVTHTLLGLQHSNLDDINKQLDKYEKTFDFLNTVYGSLKTVVNVTNSFTHCRECIGDIGSLLQKYRETVASTANVEPTDTLIYGSVYRCMNHISGNIDNLVVSAADLAWYVSHLRNTTLSSWLSMLSSINTSCEDIRREIDMLYMVLYRYISCRTGYWKRSLFVPSSLRLGDVYNEAHARWRKICEDYHTGSGKHYGWGIDFENGAVMRE